MIVMHNKLYIHNIDDYILIDDEDYERVKFYRWYQSTTQGATRISAQVLEVKVKLEDFIMNRKHCYQKVKGLDYRKSNIAIDNKSARYRKPQGNRLSRYKGVSYSKNEGKWRSAIHVQGKSVFLGYFSSEEAAALSYNRAVHQYWNGEGYLNDVQERLVNDELKK